MLCVSTKARIFKLILHCLIAIPLYDCQLAKPFSTFPKKVCSVIDSGWPKDIDFHPNGLLFATAGRNGEATLWKSSDCRKGKTYFIESGWFRSVTFSPDGKTVFFGSSDGDIVILDSETWLPIDHFRAHDDSILDIAISPDGLYVGTASLDGFAKIWELEDFNPVRTIGGISDRVNSIDFNPVKTYQILTAHGGDQNSEVIAVLWDMRTGMEVNRFSGHLPYTDFLATQNPRLIENWDQATIEMFNFGDITCARFSPDGVNIASASNDGALVITDTETGTPTTNITAHKGTISSVSFSADGSWILTTSLDGSSKLWEATTFTETTTFIDNEVGLINGKFSHDSLLIGIIADDHSISVWSTKE